MKRLILTLALALALAPPPVIAQTRTITVVDGNNNRQTIPVTPPVGQTTMATSLPVAIATDQSPVPVTVAAPTVLAAGSAQIGTVGNTTFGASQSGAWTTGRTWSLSSGTDSIAVTPPASSAATSTPISQTVTTGTTLIGPFAPQLGRDIWVTIIGNGSAVGAAQLLRSTDAGATKNAITAGGQPWGSWTITAGTPVAVNEAIVTATDGATYYITETLSAGSTADRIGQ